MATEGRARVVRLSTDLVGGILVGMLVYFLVDVVAADWLHRDDGLEHPPWSALLGTIVLFGVQVVLAWTRPRLALVAAVAVTALGITGLVAYGPVYLAEFDPLALEPRALVVFGAQEPLMVASATLLFVLAALRRRLQR